MSQPAEDEDTAVHEVPPGAAPADHAEPPPPPAEPDGDALDDDLQSDGTGLAAERLLGVIESLLFVSDRPLTVERLCELLPAQPKAALREALNQLVQRHSGRTQGLRLHQVAGGYQLRTAPHNAPYVQKLLQAKPVRLSRAQLETMAIVAYRQPITRPEIDDIRGVDSGGTLKTLLERHLIRILGKKEEPGRPMLYGTTREFLEFFNLRDLRDLPTLREFHELSEEHQGKVNAAGPGMVDVVDLEGEPDPASAPPGSGSRPPPPPLTRVELKDLNLGDDDSQLREIDEMIGAVNMDFKLDEVLAQGQAPTPPPPAADNDDRDDHDDEREPEL